MSESPVDERDLFFAALKIGNPEGRTAFLKHACEGDEALVERLGDLLRLSESEGDGILDPSRFSKLAEERELLAAELFEENQFIDELQGRSRRLGDYELFEEIGRGAVGIVFRARQVSLNREVAVKVTFGSAISSQSERERFRVEAEAAAHLSHPNIVPIYEIGHYEGHDYYSMALIMGGTLRDLMGKDPLCPRDAVRLMVKIARAVQVAHQRGIIHRDLKPENILLDEQGEPHVSDFGIASRLDQENTLTVIGQILGTPRYMAPELAEGGEVDITTKADIYALGAILYEMLASRPAFRSDSIISTLQLIKEQPALSLRTHLAKVDRDLDTIVLKCLEKDPDARYRSANAFADDLEAWLENRPISARPPTPADRLKKWVKRRPAHAALVGMGALLLLTLGIGGPLTAYRQAQLRQVAEEARAEAEAERQAALVAVRRNRALAYDFGSRLNSRAARNTPERYVLSAHAMLNLWRPKAGEPDDRGWEWYFTYARTYEQPIDVPGNGAALRALRFSPDGSLFACSWDGKPGLQVRDGMHSAMVHGFYDGSVTRMAAWSSDGAWLAGVSEEGKAAIWDLAKGRKAAQLPRSDIRSAAWHGSSIMTGHADGSLRRWEHSPDGNWTEAGVFQLGKGSLDFLDWSLDGSRIAVAANGSTQALVWHIDELDTDPRPLQGHRGPIRQLAWNSGGDWLATVGDDLMWRIWEASTGARLVRSDKSDGGASRIAWDSHGLRLVFATRDDRTIKLFHIDEDRIEPIGEMEQDISAMDWSADAFSLAVGRADGSIRLKRIGLPESKRRFVRRSGPVDALRWSADGGLLHARKRNGGEEFIDVVLGRLFKAEQISPGVEWINHEPSLPPDITPLQNGDLPYAEHPIDQRVAVGYSGGRIRIWDTRTNEVALSERTGRSEVTALAWDAQGHRLAVANSLGSIVVLDATAGYLLAREDSELLREVVQE